MVRLASAFSLLQPCNILVVGDLMVDAYTFGSAKRISPEAPVAVIEVEHFSEQPGGAGNVALNIASLSGKVSLLGRIGCDATGQKLLQSLQRSGVETCWIVEEEGYPTPLKNRILAENQQIIRLDHEKIQPLSAKIEAHLLQNLEQMLVNVQLIALSDYAKGFLTPTLLQALMHLAKEKNIPVVVDPKGLNWEKYQGAFVIKPNLKEAYLAAGLDRKEPLEAVAEKLLAATQASYLMITRGDLGISLFAANKERCDFAVESRQVKDVTGAGDTVLATIAVALASGLNLKEAIELANVAAGIAIEQVGCWHVTLPELAASLLETNAAYKVFKAEHLFVLQQALVGQKFNLLALKASSAISAELFKAIHDLCSFKLPLILYILDEPQDYLVEALTHLKDVAFVICKSANLAQLDSSLPLHQTFLFEGGELIAIDSLSKLANQ